MRSAGHSANSRMLTLSLISESFPALALGKARRSMLVVHHQSGTPNNRTSQYDKIILSLVDSF